MKIKESAMKIEKNVPIPPVNRKLGCGRPKSAARIVFEAMEVGESAVFDGNSARQKGCKAYGIANAYGRQSGKSFLGRKDVPGKVRIWRVK